MAESVLMDAFVIGLRLSLQAEVVSKHPHTLKACMEKAQMVNYHNLDLKLAQSEYGYRGLEKKT